MNSESSIQHHQQHHQVTQNPTKLMIDDHGKIFTMFVVSPSPSLPHPPGNNTKNNIKNVLEMFFSFVVLKKNFFFSTNKNVCFKMIPNFVAFVRV